MLFRKWIHDTDKNLLIFSRKELNKLILKSLLSTALYPNKMKFYFSFLLRSYSKRWSVSFFRRFCVLTGHPKSVFRYFKLSRHQGKKYASNGFLVGMRKSSF